MNKDDAKVVGRYDSSKYSKSLREQCPKTGDLFLKDSAVLKAEVDFINAKYYILTEKPKTQFRVGDTVECTAWGTGEVTNIDDDSRNPYPIAVRFSFGESRTFDVDGYYNMDKRLTQRIKKVVNPCREMKFTMKVVPVESTVFANLYDSRIEARNARTGKELQAGVPITF